MSANNPCGYYEPHGRFRGGFNGSAQHLGRTQLALKTKAKSLARVRSAGTLPWLGFDRVQPKQTASLRKALSNQRIGWCCVDRLNWHSISVHLWFQGFSRF